MGVRASNLVMDVALLDYRMSKIEYWRLKRTLRDIIHSYPAECREKYPVVRVPYQFFNRLGYFQKIIANQIEQLNQLIDNCEEPNERISFHKAHLDKLKAIPGFRLPSHVDEGAQGGARQTKRQSKRQRHIKRRRTRKA